MKKKILLILCLLLSNSTFSQSLIIYKTDQSSLSFALSEVDSITFSVTSLAKALDVSTWECITTEPAIEEIDPSIAVFEEVEEGLKIYGSDDQINKAIHLGSISDNPIMDKNIYLKWKADGTGDFMDVSIDLYADTTRWTSAYRMINLTTNHSSDGSKVIAEDTWYFTRIIVTSNMAVATTATENYDNHGGTIIQELSTPLMEPVKTFTFGTKANKASYMILGEARIE